MAKVIAEHPALSRDYEILIGGIAYFGSCESVWADEDGDVYASCRYYNSSNRDQRFNVMVDSNGDPV